MDEKNPPLIEMFPGCGFSQEDWDDVDFPEMTDEELASMRPAKEALPPKLYKALVKMQREREKMRGRPPVEKPKKQVTLRLDDDVVEAFRASGKGWQGRINAALRKASGLDPA